MKYLMLLYTILFVFSFSKLTNHHFPSENLIFKTIVKSLNTTNYIRTHFEYKDYLQKIQTLNLPENVKNWIKTVNPINNNSVSNIYLSYDPKIGGKAIGELFYLGFRNNKVSFYYGIYEAVLSPLGKFTTLQCMNLAFGKRCKNIEYKPTISEEALKSYIGDEMRKDMEKKLSVFQSVKGLIDAADKISGTWKSIVDAFKTVHIKKVTIK